MRPKKIVRIARLLANFFSRLTTSYYIKFRLVYFFRFTKLEVIINSLSKI